MTRAPRFIGYAFMAAAAMLAAVMKKEGVESVGPLPAVAVALFLGMVGVMLVFTDLMVRGLYAQVDAAKRHEEEGGEVSDKGAGD
jgi:Na+/H+-dicarboxylate symporter